MGIIITLAGQQRPARLSPGCQMKRRPCCLSSRRYNLYDTAVLKELQPVSNGWQQKYITRLWNFNVVFIECCQKNQIPWRISPMVKDKDKILQFKMITLLKKTIRKTRFFVLISCMHEIITTSTIN